MGTSSRELRSELEEARAKASSASTFEAIAIAAIAELERREQSSEEPPFFGPNGHYGWIGK